MRNPIFRNGKRPGIYTYLGGYANFWPKSIMKYYFLPFMEKEQSHCYSPENLVISQEDQMGIEKWYPAPGQALLNMQKYSKSCPFEAGPVHGF
jgi:hypothetical protein